MCDKPKSAAERAVERWGEFGYSVRDEVRAAGIRGPLPQLDRYAVAARGGGYARFLADFVDHVRTASRDRVPADVVARELGALAADVVSYVYSEPPRAA